ncbi:MAG: hypothetical protein ACXWF9_11025 [Solirubrobacterales bacterium]
MPAVATGPSAATATLASGEGRPEMAHSTGRLFEPARSTLEDIILGAWEDLAARGRAECPVCHGELELAGCASCGSELS